MTKILIVTDENELWADKGLRDPFVTIERVEGDETAEEWVDPGHKVTCSTGDPACIQWGIDEAASYGEEDLIQHAEIHVDNHARATA